MSHYLGYGAPPTVQQKHTCESMEGTVVTQLGPIAVKTPMCRVGSRYYNSQTGLEVTTSRKLLLQCSDVGGTLKHGTKGGYACNLKGVDYTSNGMFGWYDNRSGKPVLIDLYKLTGKKPPATPPAATADKPSIAPIIIAATAALFAGYLLAN